MKTRFPITLSHPRVFGVNVFNCLIILLDLLIPIIYHLSD